MTITALVVRRFNLKANGVASIERVVKQLELPALPSRDMILDPADGSAEAVVWTVRLRSMGAHPPPVASPRVELRCKTEPGDRLQAVLAAGWVALPADPPGPVAST